MKPLFVVRVDDVCPVMRWDAMAAAERVFRAAGVRPLLGIVPDNRDPDLRFGAPRPGFWEAARRWARDGWAVAQHGYQHVHCTRDGGLLGVQPRSEFAGLPYELQREKLERGRRLLAREGLETRVFMAPSHSFDAVTMAALRDAGFTTVTDGFSLFPYDRQGLTFVPQLFSKPYHLGFGVYTLCVHVNLLAPRDLAALEDFCRRKRSLIGDFAQAAAARGPAWLNALSEAALRRGLGAVRAARRATRSLPARHRAGRLFELP